MRVELTASELRYEAIARYVIPVGDPSLEKLEFSVAYIDEDIGDLDSERVELTGGLTQVFGRWQQVLFLRLNREITGFPDGTEDDALLLIPGVSYASLPPNFLTGWVRDAAYYFELSGSPQIARLRSVLPAFLSRAPRSVWTHRRSVVPAHCAAKSARAGSTNSRSCPRRSASSPAATAACAASASTS